MVEKEIWKKDLVSKEYRRELAKKEDESGIKRKLGKMRTYFVTDLNRKTKLNKHGICN